MENTTEADAIATIKEILANNPELLTALQSLAGSTESQVDDAKLDPKSLGDFEKINTAKAMKNLE